MPARARDRLIDAAERLFNAEGIRAVGVERVLVVSGAGRASFYRHFSSKDDLAGAILRAYDERWRARMRAAVDAAGGDPLAVFDALAEHCAAPDVRGCASINAMVEIADPRSAAYQAAVEHKRAVLSYVDSVLAKAGDPDHAANAERLLLLIDGALVTTLRDNSPAPARRAKEIARTLLAARVAGVP